MGQDSSRKGVRDEGVPVIRGMNIGGLGRSRTSHGKPSKGTDVRVGYACTAEGAKDIHDSAKATHISSKVLVEGLGIRHGIWTDILKRVIVVHHHYTTCDLALDRQCS